MGRDDHDAFGSRQTVPQLSQAPGEAVVLDSIDWRSVADEQGWHLVRHVFCLLETVREELLHATADP